MPARPALVLGPLLRYTSAREAVIWVEMNQPGMVVVRLMRFRRPAGTEQAHTVRIGLRHYALIAFDGLRAGAWYEYEVDFISDADATPTTVWPDRFLKLPQSTFRTMPHDGEDLAVTFLSCRSMQNSPDRGVDALLAWAQRIQRTESLKFFRWPHLVLMIGDQMYADEISDRMKMRIKPARDRMAASGINPEYGKLLVFEEFCAGYVEAWSHPDLRWAMSCISVLTIFDDHEIVDDWNLSAPWLAEQRALPWWVSELRGGLMAYWVYQGAGNLAPSEWTHDGRMRPFRSQQFGRSQTGTATLEGEFSAIAAGKKVRFSYVLDQGPVRIVVGDCRSRRVLDPPRRLIMDEEEWDWFVRQCTGSQHPYLLMVLSIPVFLPILLHALEGLIEGVSLTPTGLAVLAEMARQKVDFEHWAAFPASFEAMTSLLRQLAGEGERPAKRLLAIISGDVHFTYNMEMHGMPTSRTTQVQLVSSPSRMQMKSGETKVVQAIQSLSFLPGIFGGIQWEPLSTPNGWLWFGNFIGTLHLGLGGLSVTYERAGIADVRSEGDLPGRTARPTLVPVSSFRRKV